MRSDSPALLVPAGALTAGLMLFVMFVDSAHTIPADFQFQSNFSRAEAAAFYAQARQELRLSYWALVRRDLKSLQFKCAWTHWKNGQGHVEGVVTNPNNNVMAFIKFRNGNGIWITVQQARDRNLAKLTSGKLSP